MTNMPSGSKRPHPESEHPKRPRERDEPRDWRDIHLNGASRPTDSSTARRESGYGHGSRREYKSDRRDSRPTSARDHDSRREGDSRASHRHSGDGKRRPDKSSANPSSHVSKIIDNVMNAEKEEGE
jgi:serine/threonine-protein kinase PRP4